MVDEFARWVALHARRLAHQYRLKNFDAIHVASAVEADANVFMSADKDFPQGQLIEGVWVDEPYEPGDPPLFST
ncbi:type II toxin-antitoxin system VapC family toxin [Micromonospora vinacea]|uniref:type II toxin-antitoxin system VapC family toxin n=1 Tax=Micromonospora vinacea TaxID=709878 RepID=UPI003D8C036D